MGVPQQVYMSRGAFIPPIIRAWCMHGPFVKHARVPGHSHGLHNHPGGPQDNGTTPSSRHARLPPSAPPPPLLSSPSSPSHTCCTPKCMPTASPRAWQHNEALAALMKRDDPAAFTSVTNTASPCLPKPHHSLHMPVPLTTLTMPINPCRPMPACP